MVKIKFVASCYLCMRANSNTACEKNFTTIEDQNLQKKIKLIEITFYVFEGHHFRMFVP